MRKTKRMGRVIATIKLIHKTNPQALQFKSSWWGALRSHFPLRSAEGEVTVKFFQDAAWLRAYSGG